MALRTLGAIAQATAAPAVQIKPSMTTAMPWDAAPKTMPAMAAISRPPTQRRISSASGLVAAKSPK